MTRVAERQRAGEGNRWGRERDIEQNGEKGRDKTSNDFLGIWGYNTIGSSGPSPAAYSIQPHADLTNLFIVLESSHLDYCTFDSPHGSHL